MTNAPDQPERQALVPAPSSPSSDAQADANGHDPRDYDWVPVRRKPRKDGWTIDCQRRFIETLADTGSVTQAALEVGMSTASCYRLRNSPDGKGFATAWDIAIQAASRRLIDLAFDRAVNGSEEPVFDKEGRRTGVRMRHNDRLLMFLLRAHQPERFRDAHRQDRSPGEALPPPAPPVEAALAALAPPPPAEPHRLLAPDDLAAELQMADMLDGDLAPWHRGGGKEEADALPDPVAALRGGDPDLEDER